MTPQNIALLVSRLILLGTSIGLVVSGHWFVGLALAGVTLAATVYWQRPTGRARRLANEPVVLDPSQLAFGVAFLIIGLGVLVLLVGGVVSGDAARSVVLLGPLAMGCLLIGLRYLTAVRLQRAVSKPVTVTRVLVGTGDSRFSRLRAIGLEAGRLVTVEASALGRPQKFQRVPLSEVSAIEEPEIGSIRVNIATGGSFWVRRGSSKDARIMAQELIRCKGSVAA